MHQGGRITIDLEFPCDHVINNSILVTFHLKIVETPSPSKLHSQVHSPHFSTKRITFSNFQVIFKQCVISCSPHTCHNNLSLKHESFHSFDYAPLQARYIYTVTIVALINTHHLTIIVRKSFDIKSRSNPLSNHRLWHYCWIMSEVWGNNHVEPITSTSTQVSWAPHFKQTSKKNYYSFTSLLLNFHYSTDTCHNIYIIWTPLSQTIAFVMNFGIKYLVSKFVRGPHNTPSYFMD